MQMDPLIAVCDLGLEDHWSWFLPGSPQECLSEVS